MALLSRLDRYLGRSVLRSTLLVFAVLLALLVFVAFIDEFKDYGKGHFGLAALMSYVILSIPRRTYEIFPAAVLIGTMMGLSLLALGSELTALRAAGVSLGRIIVAAMKTGVMFVAAGVMIGEVVVPWSDTAAQQLRSQALQIALHREASGLWLRDASSFINVGEVLPDLTLLNVNIYRFDEAGRLQSQTFAERARYQEPDWQLENVAQSVVEGDEVHTRSAAAGAWRSVVTPDVVRLFAVSPVSLSAAQLYGYIQHLRRNRQETGRYELALWHKLFVPAATAVMVLLAVPAAFAQVRGGGMGQKVFLGLLLALVFSILNRGFGHVAVLYGLPPALAAALPVGTFLALALYLIRRAG